MEVYSLSIGFQEMMIANIQKTLTYSLGSRNNLTYNNRKRKQSLVVFNTLKSSGGEPQSGVAVTIVRKEGDGGDVIGGNNGNGKYLGGGGGGGGGDGDSEGGDDEEEDDEFGPIMKFEEVMKETEARGASLPADMLEAAKSGGLRELLLLRYLELQV